MRVEKPQNAVFVVKQDILSVMGQTNRKLSNNVRNSWICLLHKDLNKYLPKVIASNACSQVRKITKGNMLMVCARMIMYASMNITHAKFPRKKHVLLCQDHCDLEENVKTLKNTRKDSFFL